MPRKQSRRAISVSRETYDAIKKRAAETGTTGSGLVEFVVRKYLGLDEQEMRPARVKKEEPAPTPEPIVVKPVAAPTPMLAKDLKKEPEITIKKKEVEAPKSKDTILGDKASSIFTF